MYEWPTTQPMSLVVNIVSPGCDAEDVAHRRRERDRVAAGVALHALGLAGRARRVEDVRRLATTRATRRAPARPCAARAAPRSRGRARRRPRIAGSSPRLTMITLAGGCCGEADRLVDQVLVRDRLAAAHAGVGGDHHLRLARRRCAWRGSPRRSRRTRPSGSRRCARRRASRTPPRRSSACRSARGRRGRRPAPCSTAAKRFTSACELAVRVGRASAPVSVEM